MTREQKALLRLAIAIHQRNSTRKRQPRFVTLPEATWSNCQTLARQARRAHQHGWHLAVARLERKCRETIDRLSGELVLLTQQPESTGTTMATAPDIYRDLLALHDEFDNVSWNRRRQTLSVTTEPIELEGIFLGPFEIRLDWSDLIDGHPHNYRAIAADAHPAAVNESVTYPHVQDETVCEGEGRVPIRNAFQHGRLLDFFLIVKNLLCTYNSSSPHVSLENWHGIECNDCGSNTSEDEYWTCEKCEAKVCGECYVTCGACDGIFCAQCVARCESCHQDFCRGCLHRCASAATSPAVSVFLVVIVNKKGVPIAMTKNLNECQTHGSFPQSATTDPPTRVLRFSPTAWAKLLLLRDYGETEVGGFGVTAADDLLFIEDVQLVKQVCSWAHVRLDDESVADFFDQQVDLGPRPEQFGRVWVHTHPAGCPQPSQTDEETFAHAFGRANWAIMFILAKRGQTYAHLQFNVGPGGSTIIPIEVDYRRPFLGCDFDAWQREYDANVQVEDVSRPTLQESRECLPAPLERELPHEWVEDWFEYVEGNDEPLREEVCP